MFTSKLDASNVWRGIKECTDYISKGIQSEVGNDRNTEFWTQRCVCNKSLIQLACCEIPEHMTAHGRGLLGYVMRLEVGIILF